MRSFDPSDPPAPSAPACPAASARVYAPTDDDGLRRLSAAAVHGALRAFVQHDDYPCVGAKAALNRGSYRLGFYGSLASAPRTLVEDLRWFGGSADAIDERFATFVSVFTRGPAPRSDEAFERELWTLLQRMHEIDAAGAPWDPAVSEDPSDPDFSFSVGGRAFFVIGMHPHATREARRFCYPIVVWNLHEQFERLRAAGRFEPMRDTIRDREASLEGSPNAALADHGDRSEAAQYAGVPHGEGWTPDFTPRAPSEDRLGSSATASDATPRCPFHANPVDERRRTPPDENNTTPNGPDTNGGAP